MILDCLARVIRTGGIKTAAAAEQGADGNLVQTQQRDQDRLHGIRMQHSHRAAKRANRGWTLPVRLMLLKRLKPADPAAIPAAAAVHRAWRFLAPPCRASTRFPFETTPSAAAKPRSETRPCRFAWTGAAARPSPRTRRAAGESSRGRCASRDCAWLRAARTFCRRQALGDQLDRLASRRRRNASNDATGANEKRMRIHPF